MELNGKTALVTGGSQGLGEQLCRELAEAGMHVIVNCARSAARTSASMLSGARKRSSDASTVQG